DQRHIGQEDQPGKSAAREHRPGAQRPAGLRPGSERIAWVRVHAWRAWLSPASGKTHGGAVPERDNAALQAMRRENRARARVAAGADLLCSPACARHQMILHMVSCETRRQMAEIPASSIAVLLGIKPKTPAFSSLDLANEVGRGFSVDAVDRLCRVVAPAVPGFRYQIISKATLSRRNRTAKRRL